MSKSLLGQPVSKMWLVHSMASVDRVGSLVKREES